MEKLEMKVDVQNLMLQASKEMRSFQMAMGFKIATDCLQRIAKRAIEIKDEQILKELETLCLVQSK